MYHHWSSTSPETIRTDSLYTGDVGLEPNRLHRIHLDLVDGQVPFNSSRYTCLETRKLQVLIHCQTAIIY